MDDLRKIHIIAGWVLTGCGIALIVINALNFTSFFCLAVGVMLLAFAKRTPA
jgi:uncharacterized membrane protein YbaN (DUF454 family)